LLKNYTFLKVFVPKVYFYLMFLRFYLPSTAIRTRGYVNNARNLPTSRSQRTQGRNIPVQGNPSLRYVFFLWRATEKTYICSVARHRKNTYLFCGAPQKNIHVFFLWRATEKIHVFCSVARRIKKTCIFDVVRKFN